MVKHTLRLPGKAHQNVYGVEVYQRDDAVTVVLSEVDENAAGTSITNAVEIVATDVVHGLIEQGLVRDPNAVRWIEHYPGRDGERRAHVSGLGEPTWDDVMMRWQPGAERYGCAKWRPLPSRHAPPDLSGWRKLY